MFKDSVPYHSLPLLCNLPICNYPECSKDGKQTHLYEVQESILSILLSGPQKPGLGCIIYFQALFPSSN